MRFSQELMLETAVSNNNNGSSYISGKAVIKNLCKAHSKYEGEKTSMWRFFFLFENGLESKSLVRARLSLLLMNCNMLNKIITVDYAFRSIFHQSFPSQFSRMDFFGLHDNVDLFCVG